MDTFEDHAPKAELIWARTTPVRASKASGISVGISEAE
jgi:hypothetical protein